MELPLKAEAFYTVIFEGRSLGLLLSKHRGFIVVHQRTNTRIEQHGPIARPHVGDIVLSIDNYHVTSSTTVTEIAKIAKGKLKSPSVQVLFMRDDRFVKNYIEKGRFGNVDHQNSCQLDKFTGKEMINRKRLSAPINSTPDDEEETQSDDDGYKKTKTGETVNNDKTKKDDNIHPLIYPDETDLTTFRSAGYEKLVDHLFQDEEIGNVTLGELRETNYNDFIESFSRNNPAIRMKIVNWINTNHLRGEFLSE